MTSYDIQYKQILEQIIKSGSTKETRAGKVRSIFGSTIRVNLQEGLPLLTTKKVFYRGIIHELCWFIKGSTNIKYLVDNNVHIWDDDAYRYYKDNIFNQPFMCSQTDDMPVSKEEFLTLVQTEQRMNYIDKNVINPVYRTYVFGDLGPVYGQQWRRFGVTQRDQLQNIVDTLKTNPDDRRMLCVAFNPDVVDEVALPPCHVLFQFYTEELPEFERKKIALAKGLDEDDQTIPTRKLSLCYYMRSNDWCCGQPFNTASYAMLVYILCDICNMVPGEVIFFGGDTHMYENHLEQAQEQLQRIGYSKCPRFIIKKHMNSLDDVCFDNFEVVDYQSDAAIRYPLNVG